MICKNCKQEMKFTGYTEEGHADFSYDCKCGQSAIRIKSGEVIWFGSKKN